MTGLCTKVAKALREAGGATAEYQQVVIEIEGLQDALTRLAALEPTESNIDHVNAIRRMALACQLPMKDFLLKLEQYESTMSPFTTSKSFRATGKKARYAVFMSEEVKTMRAMISGKVISINLLLATHASESLSRSEDRLATDHEVVLDRLAEAKAEMSAIRRDMERNQTAISESHGRFCQQSSEIKTDVVRRLDEVRDDRAKVRRGISDVAVAVGSVSKSLAQICTMGTQVLAILRTFPSELRILLDKVLRTNMQMYAILLKIQRKVAASPTLALHSNIRFEDALGEIRSLPFEWFRHWEVSKDSFCKNTC